MKTYSEMDTDNKSIMWNLSAKFCIQSQIAKTSVKGSFQVVSSSKIESTDILRLMKKDKDRIMKNSFIILYLHFEKMYDSTYYCLSISSNNNLSVMNYFENSAN